MSVSAHAWYGTQNPTLCKQNKVEIFDDHRFDKRYARNIGLARRQYSGNAKGVINGIGVVTCVYVNPDLDRFWVIDYRVYDPQTE